MCGKSTGHRNQDADRGEKVIEVVDWGQMPRDGVPVLVLIKQVT